MAEILLVETRDVPENTTTAFMISFINKYSNRIFLFIIQFSLIPLRTNKFPHSDTVLLGLMLYRRTISFLRFEEVPPYLRVWMFGYKNAGIQSPSDTTSYPRRMESSTLPLLKSQDSPLYGPQNLDYFSATWWSNSAGIWSVQSDLYLINCSLTILTQSVIVLWRRTYKC